MSLFSPVWMCLSCKSMSYIISDKCLEKDANVSIIKAFKRQTEGGILHVDLYGLAQTSTCQDVTSGGTCIHVEHSFPLFS